MQCDAEIHITNELNFHKHTKEEQDKNEKIMMIIKHDFNKFICKDTSNLISLPPVLYIGVLLKIIKPFQVWAVRPTLRYGGG